LNKGQERTNKFYFGHFGLQTNFRLYLIHGCRNDFTEAAGKAPKIVMVSQIVGSIKIIYGKSKFLEGNKIN